MKDDAVAKNGSADRTALRILDQKIVVGRRHSLSLHPGLCHSAPVLQAVRQAVAAAQQELLGELAADENEVHRDLVTLLEHPPFAQEVTRCLLFRGQPDFDQLRRFYLPNDPRRTSERWHALEVPLADFFALIERHLEPSGDDAPGNLLDAFAPCFPLRLVLRRLSAKIDDTEAGIELFYRALGELNPDVPRERWLERLDDPRTLLLLDGLDEVPAAAASNRAASPAAPSSALQEPDHRRLILGAIQDLHTVHPQCKILVSCRIKPYQQGSHQLVGWPTCELARLDPERIDRFIGRWYDELVRIGRLTTVAEALACGERLRQALARSVLAEMAGTPLLLTMLARVNARAALPEGRVELYGECVEQLLWEWERGKSASGGTLSLDDLLRQPQPPIRRADVEGVLWQLTYELHGTSGKSTVDLPASRLREALAKVHPQRHQGWAWADEVLELMRLRDGLLVAVDDEVFTFPHRSFQEYLAARGLLLREDAVPALASAHAGDDAWREVVLLACGYLAKEQRLKPAQLVVHQLIARPPRPASDPAGGRSLA